MDTNPTPTHNTHYTKEYTMHGITVFFESMLELGEYISINTCIDGMPFIEEAHACWVESENDPAYPILCMQVESAGVQLAVKFAVMNICSHCKERHTYSSRMCEYGYEEEEHYVGVDKVHMCTFCKVEHEWDEDDVFCAKAEEYAFKQERGDFAHHGGHDQDDSGPKRCVDCGLTWSQCECEPF